MQDSFFEKKVFSSKRKLLVNYDEIVLLSIEKYSKKWYIYAVSRFIFNDPSYLLKRKVIGFN